MKFRMKSTDEYERLVKFFIDNGLEFDEDEKDSSNVIKCWKISMADDSLVAACSLVDREGHFVIEGMAVEEVFRKFGLGTLLMKKAMAEVKARGGKELILMARKPGFYEKLGFTVVKPEDAPQIFDCLGCPQYRVDCHPEIMKIEIQ